VVSNKGTKGGKIGEPTKEMNDFLQKLGFS
jgi:hypothetical protein